MKSAELGPRSLGIYSNVASDKDNKKNSVHVNEKFRTTKIYKMGKNTTNNIFKSYVHLSVKTYQEQISTQIRHAEM